MGITGSRKNNPEWYKTEKGGYAKVSQPASSQDSHKDTGTAPLSDFGVLNQYDDIEIEHAFTEGDCYELADALVKKYPERFEVVVFFDSESANGDYFPGFEHAMVRDKNNGDIIDINGNHGPIFTMEKDDDGYFIDDTMDRFSDIYNELEWDTLMTVEETGFTGKTDYYGEPCFDPNRHINDIRADVGISYLEKNGII